MQVPIYQRGLANLALARSPKRHLAIKVVACDRNRDNLCRDFAPNFAHAFNARCLTVVSEFPGRGGISYWPCQSLSPQRPSSSPFMSSFLPPIKPCSSFRKDTGSKRWGLGVDTTTRNGGTVQSGTSRRSCSQNQKVIAILTH